MGGSKKAVLGGAIALGLLAATVAALLYANPHAITKDGSPPPAESELARFAIGPLAALETPADLAAAPSHPFLDREGAEARFSDFRGRVVVVNLWAMWCAPCRTEMPTLARLARAYQGREDFMVLTVNVDTGDAAVADARRFLDAHDPLAFYGDPSFRLPFEFPGKGKMPQTILLDRQGRVRAAFSGEADWAGPQARALVDALLAEV